MKIIPTVFDGIKFRSRLEARWAVFFKSLGIKYEWEPESFDLGDGIWYLPDFHLPFFNHGVYCEVKPSGGEFKKALKFAEVVGKDIWLCEGPPDFKIYTLLERVPYTPEEMWIVQRTEVIPMFDHGFEENRFWYQPGFDVLEPEDCNYRLRDAIYSAKNARFGVHEDY